jgi:hypothetical protein
MSKRNVVFMFFVLAASLAAAPLAVRAQNATPVEGAATPPAGGGTVIASGLTHPRGFTWDADGNLYVGLAGTGGPSAPTEDAPTNHAVGPWGGGMTASVVRIDAGCPVTVAGDLPSAVDQTGGVLGADDVAFLNGELFVAIDGGGAAHGNPDTPSGIYRVLDDGSTELVADLSAWVRANPVAEIPADFDPDAAGYSMIAEDDAGVLWVVDPNSGQILTVTPDGTVTRVADVSMGHPVPTRLALDPNGGVYVGTLSAVPFADGAAKVMHVTPDGTVTDVWTGLTVVTAVAVAPDGTLYALEMSTGNLAEPPFLVPGSGKLVRQTGPDSAEDVLTGLMFPVAMRIGLDGAFYVASPALGAMNGEGVILRFDLGAGAPAATPVSAACPLPATPPVGATPVA